MRRLSYLLLSYDLEMEMLTSVGDLERIRCSIIFFSKLRVSDILILLSLSLILRDGCCFMWWKVRSMLMLVLEQCGK